MSSEQSDVNVRGIFSFGAGLIGLTGVVYLVVWLLFGYLTKTADREGGATRLSLAAQQSDRLPPEPRLQINPKQDLKDLRAAEDDMLNSYRWVDRNAGIVRIPIEEAKRIILQNGLPARQQPGEPAK